MPVPFPWEWLLAVAGAITVFIGAGSAVFKLFSPYKKIISRLDRHDRLFENDHQRLRNEEESTIAILEALYALLEHARTDNSTGLMDEASKTLQGFLIRRK